MLCTSAAGMQSALALAERRLRSKFPACHLLLSMGPSSAEPKDVSSFADTVCSVLPDRREDRTTASDSDESPALQGTSNDPSVRMYTDCREKRMGKSLTLRFNAFQKFVLLQEVDPSKEVCKAGE